MTLIDKSAVMPLYEQLYEAYKKQILAGLLCPGTKLPATRRLAADLGIGRNTVDNAYQQLEMEGYVTAKPCSGYIINEIDLPNEVPVSNLAAVPQRLKHQTTLARYDFGGGSLLLCFRSRLGAVVSWTAWTATLCCLLIDIPIFRVSIPCAKPFAIIFSARAASTVSPKTS